jgi:hypothetical protein
LFTGCGKKATVVAVTAAEEGGDKKRGEPFAFGKDEGGKLLASVLPPQMESSGHLGRRGEPRVLPGSRDLEHPDIRLPLATADGSLPSASVMKEAKALRPRMLPAEAPWTRHSLEHSLLLPEPLPIAPLASVPSLDVERSLSVPILQYNLPDRASLDDPTAAFSLDAVLATQAPERASPAPVWFLNLPDPFEFHHVSRLLTPLPEDNVLPH